MFSKAPRTLPVRHIASVMAVLLIALSNCSVLALAAMGAAQEPPAPEMPTAVTDPRPVAQFLIYMMEKTGLKYCYEDPVWVYEADAVDSTPWSPGKMRFPVPRTNTIQVGKIDFAPLRKSVDAVSALRPIIERYNDAPGTPARFEVREKDGMVIVVAVQRHAKDGRVAPFQSVLDKEIELPAATQTRNERLESFCEELSKVSEVPIDAAHGGIGLDSSPALAWPAERTIARDFVLRFLAGERDSSFYHLLCDPVVPGAEGACTLNIGPIFVEVEAANGQKVLRQVPNPNPAF